MAGSVANGGAGGKKSSVCTVIEGVHVATMDVVGAEHPEGYIVVEGTRIVAVGNGPVPEKYVAGSPGRHICQGAGERLLVTPGLVNCHHHLCQWLTRGYAADSNLFDWLVTLYPVWQHIDDEMQHAAATAGLASLALSGCTLASDHHYLHPHNAGDMLAIEIAAARELGMRFHPCRGSMDLGQREGGLPPDEVVEQTDVILAATEDAITRFHDPGFDSMLRIAVAPCSPFTVTRRLMRESAELARRHGVRLHTHLAETVEEDAFCAEKYGMRPVEYLEELGWLGDDVWLAHCVHLNDAEVARFGQTNTGVAHCPSSNARLGAGIARVADLVRAGAPVGLGVDGAASNEAGELALELREAMLFARLRGGPTAMSARESLALGTMHGARCLGRQSEVGSIEVGKCADLAVWDLSGYAHAGIEDPVTALVFGPPLRVRDLLVNGELVVADGELQAGDVDQIGRELARQSARLAATAREKAHV